MSSSSRVVAPIPFPQSSSEIANSQAPSFRREGCTQRTMPRGISWLENEGAKPRRQESPVVEVEVRAAVVLTRVQLNRQIEIEY